MDNRNPSNKLTYKFKDQNVPKYLNPRKRMIPKTQLKTKPNYNFEYTQIF